ncbi:dicarboxylate/amino acid:cation symporter [Lonepinella sp. BR2474]|uniref:dicarboxylate/amino acid:cation symporter n=1 Tax=Lonepinella sp. BR2474 TaxID=3434548 RepID=UPI003F6DEC27
MSTTVQSQKTSKSGNSKLLVRIIIALVLGSAIGMILPQNFMIGDTSLVGAITPFGDLFVRLLKMIMVPIIICSLIIGSSSISPDKLGRVGGKAILFYAITTLLAIGIGLASATIFSPGLGLDLSDASKAVEKAANAPSMGQILLNIIPTNPFDSIAKGDILPIIAFCLFFGIGLAYCRASEDERIKNSANTVYSFFDGMSEIMFKVVGWVMQYAPIGVFALMFVVFNKSGAAAFSSLLNVTVTYFLGLIVMILVVYSAVCASVGLSPATFLKKVRPAMLTAFVTRSSNGTLPITMQCAENMGIPKSVYGFVLPVGATVNMNGTTVYLGVCTLFIANACGITLTGGDYFTIIITSMLAAIGTAGVPGAGALMLLLVLESVGIKVSGSVAIAYGMILGIDSILDMGRTWMNVTGDAVASVYVAKTEKELDVEQWNS